ncbi:MULTISPECIES: transporter substrate-binding domain-containing protein [Terrabacteria group]|uniref:transporter substrate-binding domain-containing protein n=1 Tax=Bacillati TaxID=1783272 RepID=UPI00193A0271|nr:MULTISPECIES: transporter substrate-binding domain-containing protein [Terrabacteria group]MBW9212576.1 transporter substrate-binding domain-containing protein [Trueperella sp. zg.1013]QRG86673.1 transporter substrate-binding domain-containing protein [Bulleidia sp. zg-1006]
MKNMVKLVMSAILSLSLVACGTKTSNANKDNSLQKVKDAGVLKVGLEGNWKPFSYHDDKDQLLGYDVEVAQNIAKKLGVKAEFKEAAWDGLLTGLSTGVYDVVVNGVDVTEDRKQAFDMSDAYAYDRIDLVVKEGTTNIKSFEDLKNKKATNSTGSTYATIAEKYGAKVSNVPTLAETMQLVLNGTADATINADTSVNDYLNTTGEKKLKVIAQLPDITEYAIPMKKGHDSLREAVNQALKELREDGTLATLSKKYFGKDLTNK